MYCHYFQEWEVRPEFQKEFISLWSGWLGEANLHKLDQVTEAEWGRFNTLLALTFERYEVFIANPEEGILRKAMGASELTQAYSEAMAKDASTFTRLVIPELNCALTEDWDYTYILWHKGGSAIAALAPLIEQAQLHHFGP